MGRARHRSSHRSPLRQRDRWRRDHILERPDGALRASAVRRRDRAVADALAAANATTVVGGGETVAAVRSFGLQDTITHISTGGGATLELLEGRTLPGVQALLKTGDPVTLPPGPEWPAIESVCLIVMDGWGSAPPGPGNAIALADTPTFDELWAGYPHAELTASGTSVGLPDGQMGNSEVGHLTLGAGAAVPQTLTLINDAVATGGLAANEVVRAALSAGKRVHLVGMVSDGGVHSGFEHLHALIKLAGQLDTPDLVLHCFTDGRDTSPTSGEHYLRTLEDWCTDAGVGRVATVIGRFYAMDRDHRWQRTQAAYDLIVHGRGQHHAQDGPAAAREAYARGETDEFITATTVGAEGRIRPGDSVFCFNFRPDRMRQLVRALADPRLQEEDEELPGWRGRDGAEPVRRLATMTEYQQDFPIRSHSAPHVRPTRSAQCSHGRECSSCTWRRPRNTPTSPTSSTVGRSTPSPGSAGSWSHRSATSPPTTSNRR